MKKAAMPGGSGHFSLHTLSQPQLHRELSRLELQLAQRGCRHPEVVAHLLLQHRLTAVLDKDSRESRVQSHHRDNSRAKSVSNFRRNPHFLRGAETEIGLANSADQTGALDKGGQR